MWGRTRWHLKQINDRELVLYGSGRAVKEVLNDLDNTSTIRPSFLVSKDFAENSEYAGLKVLSPTVLDSKQHYVFISSRIYYAEMAQILVQKGFVPGADFYDFFNPMLKYDIMGGKDLNVPYGKCSYFCSANADHIISCYIERFGAFCQMNQTLAVSWDRDLSRIPASRIFPVCNEDIIARCDKSVFNKVSFGNDVWVGANVFINASKVKSIGDGAIIGAGAVVLEDVPPYAIVAGVPAKVKRYRFTEKQIDILLRVKWWDWDNDTIYKNTELLMRPEKFFEAFQ